MPFIQVTRPGNGLLQTIGIKTVSWKRLRCTVELSGPSSGLLVDIRVRAADPVTSLVAAPKPVEADGQVSLLVADEDREGVVVVVVILDLAGAVQTQAATTVGA